MERTTAMKTIDSKLTDRDASFSSYLTPEKPNTCQPNHHHHNQETLDDPTSELNIFDAHKYFNEVTNNNIQKVTISNNNNSRVSPVVVNVNNTDTTRYSSASSTVDSCYSSIGNYRTRPFHSAATPTASSEASWNSQQGLLSHPPGAISVTMKNPSDPNPNSSDFNNKLRKSLSKPIWLLRRKCPCTGKKSVQVKEQSQKSTEQKTQPINWVNVDQTESHVTVNPQRFSSHPLVTTVRAPLAEGFTFPVLNQHHDRDHATSALKLRVSNGVVLDETPRDSLEVFQPPDEVTVDPKPLNFPFPAAISRVVTDDCDAASDASSDLFEIESFSTATQSTCPIAHQRRSGDSFDDGMTTTMTECYEPSEASIEWSVTTADGGDESGSVAAEQWRRRGGNGLLVSCRCEKAVSVGPQPVKCEGQRGATSAWRQVSGGNISNNRGVNKPPLARSHRNTNTPRVTSLAFAT